MHSAAAIADATSAYAAFRPPKRVRVSEGAAKVLQIRQPGGYTGPWSADETPYMVEPMDMQASRRHEAVCFVGPARTGKTMGLLDGWMAHVVENDPGDMLIVQMTQDKARDYSKTRIDRAIRYSPALKAMMSSRGNDDNTFDKMFRHGMWLKIGWPTVTQLSGSDYRYVGLTDYDRMPDDIDGEGSAFALALKRTTTFLSRGMCMVESSPGRPISDPNWKPVTAHEAPPTGGILGIYNRSDRRRWYWPCPDCGDYFEATPGLSLFNLPAEAELLELVRTADLYALASEHDRIVCPYCSAMIDKRSKHEMNRRGRWAADGQMVTRDGEVVGKAPVSSIAGYWLGGVAAAYQSWHSLVLRYLQGLRDYALTGDELTLQATVNTDQGMPYMSRLLASAQANAATPDKRKEPGLERFIVPPETRFLAASVDVQGGQNARFVVQVHAVGPNLEQWPVDRYAITLSKRTEYGDDFMPIDPATYEEDWDVLTDAVVKATYRTPIEGKEIRIRIIAVDTGGEGGVKKNGAEVADGGVTKNAYAWYRRLRLEQFHGRVMLIKGASTKTAPLIKESWVGGKKQGEKGDIPLYLLNTNQLKDAVSSAFKRDMPGPGFMHIPPWLPPSWFDELNAEVRKPDGTWVKVRKRNETFDLCAYIRACFIRIGADKPAFWENPPDWAMPLESNSYVISAEARRAIQAASTSSAAAIRRRSTRSSYLR